MKRDQREDCKTTHNVNYPLYFNLQHNYHLRLGANYHAYAPPCISPSKYKPPKLVTQKNPPINRPSKEIALKFKIKQSKICSVTHKVLHLQKNYYVCEMTAVKKRHSISTLCVVHSSVLACISSDHIDKVLAWLSFRKICVLKTNY